MFSPNTPGVWKYRRGQKIYMVSELGERGLQRNSERRERKKERRREGRRETDYYTCRRGDKMKRTSGSYLNCVDNLDLESQLIPE